MIRSIKLLLLWLVSTSLIAAGECIAEGRSYLFQGHFAPSNRGTAPELAPSTPTELIGKEFTVGITWPSSVSDYSADWQTGTDNWGSYRTTAIGVNIDVPGFDFSVPPTIAQWETLNDTPLDYHLGVPQNWGDELRLVGRVDWTRKYEVDSERFSSVSEYLLIMRAVDYSGTVLHDDSLQADFDLALFRDVWFEFQQVVPVSGSDPRPIHFAHWLGIVEEVFVVPEPTLPATLFTGLMAILYCRGMCPKRSNPCRSAA